MKQAKHFRQAKYEKGENQEEEAKRNNLSQTSKGTKGQKQGWPRFILCLHTPRNYLIFKMAAFADLNVALRDDPRETVKLISKAVQLGFETIGLCKIFDPTKGVKKGQKMEGMTPMNWNRFPEIRELKKTHTKLKILSRITVLLDDPGHVYLLSHDAIQSYDILAIQPRNEKLFQQACQTLEIDVISLNMMERLPFFLKFPTMNAAIERGVHFEITYSPALRDPSRKKTLIAQAINLVAMAKGKNIIVSSGADNEMDFRGPYDLINLGLLFNFTEKQSKAAVTNNCRAVLFHKEARSDTVKSIISGKALTDADKDEEDEDDVGSSIDDSGEDESSSNSDKDDDFEPVEKKAKQE